MKKKLLTLGLGLMLAFSLTACGDKDATTTKVEEPTIEEKQLSSIDLKYKDGYAEVADNSNFTLYLSEDAYSIKVLDKATGKVWDSGALAEGFDTTNTAEARQKIMKFPFSITYVDVEKVNGTANTYPTNKADCDTEVFGIENGVRVSYKLDAIKIAVALDYTIDEQGLNIEVPMDGIKEEGSNGIASMKVFPYFADATDQADGFYFYPDGSGAVMEFQDSAHLNESSLELGIYGNLTTYKNTLDVLAQDEPEILLPVFGANINGDSFLAIIEEGEEAASVWVDTSKDTLNLNKIYCEFDFRRSFVDNRVVSRDGENKARVYDKEIIASNRKISYRFLDDASYSDMAIDYRNYLVEELGVQPMEAKDTIATSLDLFMGIKEEGLLYDEFKVVTTFEEAKEIIDRFAKEGVHSMEVQLKGWTDKGYFMDPVQFPINSKVGGNKGLEELISYADAQNVDVLLEANFLEARSEAGGFSERDDVVYLGNKSIFTNFDGSLFLVTPTTAKANLDTFIDDAKDTGISGVSFYSLGQYLFYNYNESYYVSSAACKNIWRDMLKASKDTFGKAVAQGGNSYVLGYADKITDIPASDSGYQMTTKSVPFYQIAAHGLVNMTGKAGNLSSDLATEKLKWAEFGYLPYFELTFSGSEDLMYTDYSTLFSSTFTDWIDEAAEINADFNENLVDVWYSLITDHEEVAEDVMKVTYENGSVVYVNYNDEKVTVDGIEVGAKDYTVKKG